MSFLNAGMSEGGLRLAIGVTGRAHAGAEDVHSG